MTEYDAVSQCALITHKGYSLTVDTSLSSPSAYRVRGLVGPEEACVTDELTLPSPLSQNR